MEDVLDVYQKTYDPLRPVVCIDESSKQLIGHSRDLIPASPGHPAVWDYEYVRNGVGNVFMLFEPLGCKRHVLVTERRTRIEFAKALRYVSDVMYPHAEKIIIVMDNLNTHTAGSLYEDFEPEEARRLARRFEFHYTPKHGSWLNMAETELGILMRQCLSGRTPTLLEMEQKVRAWSFDRNRKFCTVDWQFTTEDARIKLKRLYPKFIT
jgi:transposase